MVGFLGFVVLLLALPLAAAVETRAGGCNADWIGDGYCDFKPEDCNNRAMQWDGGDCCEKT